VRVPERGQVRYDPARDVDGLRMIDVEEAMRRDPSDEAQAVRSTLQRTAGPALGRVLRARHDEGFNDAGQLTLRELAKQCPIDGVTAATEPPAPGAAGPDRRKPDA
jgi:hypothetical protein